MATRWAIAGTGRMASAFAADFPYAAGAQLVAVGSRSQESADRFVGEHGGLQPGTTLRGYGSYAALVADPDVDVVYIATPHPQHRDLALGAIEAGKAVLVEKAFTATLAGARQVVDAARERGVFCMEAMWTRFQPAVVRARELIDDGAIGEVRMVQADLGAYRAYDPSSRLFAPDLGGGATLDLGVYVVSIAEYFLGAPDSIAASGTSYPNGVDASVAVQLGYADGRAASLVASLESEAAGRAVIMGTGGSIEMEPRFHHPHTFVLRRNGREPAQVVAPPSGAGYCHEIDEVARCLAAGRTESAVMPLEDTLAVQAILQAVLERLGISPAEDTVPL